LIFALLLSAIAFGAEVKIAYVGASLHETSSGRGALQGLEEAKLQGSFLGLEYSIVEATAEDAEQLRTVDAIVVAGSPDQVQAVARAVNATGVAVFNVAAAQDALRTSCMSSLLHTLPSDAMLAAGVDQWKQKSDATAVVAQAWHPAFVKFAARDLNKRYVAVWNTDMDDQAWAAWAAVRIIADAAANMQDATAAERLDYIRNDMEFDGQKGAYMTFRATGQLRQPLLIVENGELAGEAPVRGVAASDDLDSLGQLACVGGE
jgi:ABC-type branched-subunit amino acid transport system substrate-binding protein